MNRVYVVLASLFMLCIQNFCFAGSRVGFEELVVRNELNPRLGIEAKLLADRLNLPRTIVFTSGIVIDALGIENEAPVYAVMTNMAHPYEGGEAMLYSEVAQRFDIGKGVVNPTGLVVADDRHRTPKVQGSVLLVPDWTTDKVMAFDPQTGNLLDSSFIPSNSSALASPKEARLSPRMQITVSDQITDLVQAFDTSGTYIGPFAPAGGVNNAILDNIRGHAYRPNRHLVVAVASGANQNCIAEFDSAGNYLGQFIAAGAGGLNSPFSILFRSDDVLISTSSSPVGVLRYELNGTFIAIWTSISSFPQQIAQLNNGNIAVANFQGTGQTGIRLYSSTGTFLRLLSGVTGNRGVYQLGNGNYLTTNSAGIHEIDSASGNLVRTVALGANMQFINRVDFNLVDVDEEAIRPSETKLHQNYPNPFNPTTTITYEISSATNVTVKVFDMLGRQVAILANGAQEAGVHHIEFNADRLASGVYCYTLQSGAFIGSKKMIIVR